MKNKSNEKKHMKGKSENVQRGHLVVAARLEVEGGFFCCPRDVPRRALNTISSGLGPSNANPEESENVGGVITCFFLCVGLCVLSVERAEVPSDLADPIACFSRRLCSLASLRVALSSFLSSGIVRVSSISKEANAEGDARARFDFEWNIGDTGGVMTSSSGSKFCFSLAFLILMANFDFLVSGDAGGTAPRGTTYCLGIIGERVGSVRL